MAEHVDDIATYVSGEDTSELARVKAELAYALSCLDREMAIRAEADAKNELLVKALQFALAELDYIATKHGYVTTEVAAIRARECLASVGSTQQPDNSTPRKA